MLTFNPLPTRANSRQYAEARLRGTVWAGAPTLALYRAMMALGRGLGALGVSANSLTYASLLLALVAGVLAALGVFGAAAAMVLISGLLDVLDGVVARATSCESRFGALLDSTVDRLADGLPLLGVAIFYASKNPWLASVPLLVLLGGFSVSYTRARAEALGAVLPTLFMRRAERVVLLVVALTAAAFPVMWLPAVVPAPLLFIGLVLLGVLNTAGAISALVSAKRVFNGPNLQGLPAERDRAAAGDDLS